MYRVRSDSGSVGRRKKYACSLIACAMGVWAVPLPVQADGFSELISDELGARLCAGRFRYNFIEPIGDDVSAVVDERRLGAAVLEASAGVRALLAEGYVPVDLETRFEAMPRGVIDGFSADETWRGERHDGLWARWSARGSEFEVFRTALQLVVAVRPGEAGVESRSANDFAREVLGQHFRLGAVLAGGCVGVVEEAGGCSTCFGEPVAGEVIEAVRAAAPEMIRGLDAERGSITFCEELLNKLTWATDGETVVVQGMARAEGTRGANLYGAVGERSAAADTGRGSATRDPLSDSSFEAELRERFGIDLCSRCPPHRPTAYGPAAQLIPVKWQEYALPSLNEALAPTALPHGIATEIEKTRVRNQICDRGIGWWKVEGREYQFQYESDHLCVRVRLSGAESLPNPLRARAERDQFVEVARSVLRLQAEDEIGVAFGEAAWVACHPVQFGELSVRRAEAPGRDAHVQWHRPVQVVIAGSDPQYVTFDLALRLPERKAYEIPREWTKSSAPAQRSATYTPTTDPLCPLLPSWVEESILSQELFARSLIYGWRAPEDREMRIDEARLDAAIGEALDWTAAVLSPEALPTTEDIEVTYRAGGFSDRWDGKTAGGSTYFDAVQFSYGLADGTEIEVTQSALRMIVVIREPERESETMCGELLRESQRMLARYFQHGGALAALANRRAIYQTQLGVVGGCARPMEAAGPVDRARIECTLTAARYAEPLLARVETMEELDAVLAQHWWGRLEWISDGGAMVLHFVKDPAGAEQAEWFRVYPEREEKKRRELGAGAKG